MIFLIIILHALAYQVVCRIFVFSLVVFIVRKNFFLVSPGFLLSFLLSLLFSVCPVFGLQKPTVGSLSANNEKQPSVTHSAATMDRSLNILEQPQPKPEEEFDEEKVKFISGKVPIWDFYGISQATYLAYSNEDKVRMFREYYKKLVYKFYSNGGKMFLFLLI